MVGGSVSLQLDSLVRMVGCISATTAAFLVVCSLLKSCTISSKQDDPDCNLQLEKDTKRRPIESGKSLLFLVMPLF